MEQLNEALFIAGAGMGIVFLALLILMGILWGLARLLADEKAGLQQETMVVEPAAPPTSAGEPGGQVGGLDRRFRAAAAAVAVTRALTGTRRLQVAESQPEISKMTAWRLGKTSGFLRASAAGWQGRHWQERSWKGIRL